MQKIQNKQSTS